jgi:hypothetical protein
MACPAGRLTQNEESKFLLHEFKWELLQRPFPSRNACAANVEFWAAVRFERAADRKYYNLVIRVILRCITGKKKIVRARKIFGGT